MKQVYILFGLMLTFGSAFCQFQAFNEEDKCGYDPELERQLRSQLGDHWGYSYDSLLNDLSEWEASDYVQVGTIGESTQGRGLYELTITDFDDTKTLKNRVYIHARTHPNEVQSFWVTDEIINFLTTESSFGDSLREHCIFHVVPMYNPDGVELEKPRENANDIDIESNWAEDFPEVEVANLKARFETLMLEPNPVEVALNMHSAYACKRYFVCHHPNGTSNAFYEMEKDFIGSAKHFFDEGIEPYNYMITWSNGTPYHYPESWWWWNHQEDVMALTYEDMNCEEAGFYKKTAYAILNGTINYLGHGSLSIPEDMKENDLELRVYPNPFSHQITVEWNNFEDLKHGAIYDLYGRMIYELPLSSGSNGKVVWNGCDQTGRVVAPGTYIVRLLVDKQIESIRIVKH